MCENTSFMRSGKKAIVRIFSAQLIMLLLFTGCMNMRVVAQYDSDNPLPQEVTRWAWFWGLKQPNDVKTDASCSSICIITVKNNFGYALISTLSLGIAVPMRVTYECCPYEPPPGEL